MKASVIIPTIRPNSLKKTLACLDNQTNQSFETIIINDKNRRGPAWARNQGIKLAKNELIVFIGDDIRPKSEFINFHLQGHQQYPKAHTALLGFIDWPSSYKEQIFYQWLNRSGMQARYKDLQHGEIVPFTRFYTTNVSLKKAYLTENDLYFDEKFAEAACEDIDFGLRFEKIGGQLIYYPMAQAIHYHHYTPDRFFKRMYIVGKMGRYLYQKHPQLKDKIFPTHIPWQEHLRLIFWYMISPMGKLFSIKSILYHNWQRKAIQSVINGYQIKFL